MFKLKSTIKRKDWHKRSNLYKFFIQDDTKIKIECKSSAYINENGKTIVHREFYTFRALYTHFWYTFFVNPIKDLKVGIINPQLDFGLRFAIIAGILINLKNNILFQNLVLIGGAIAYDATSSGTASATSLTIAHTCSGSNRVLVVCPASGDNPAGMAVTYNGAGMTNSLFNNNSNGYLWAYTLVAPSTGAHNVVVSFTNSNRQLAGCVSLSGAAQTSIVDGTASKLGFWNSSTLDITTANANTFIIDSIHQYSSGASLACGASQTLRWNSAISGMSAWAAGSTRPTTTAGTKNNAWTGDNDNPKNGIIIGIKEVVIAAPTVTTEAVSAIAQATATGNGNVTADGGATVTERGTVYSLSANPTTADTKDTAAGTTGAFTTSIDTLLRNTTYHVRAYAINSAGTSYGADVTFTTLTGVQINIADTFKEVSGIQINIGDVWKPVTKAEINIGEK